MRTQRHAKPSVIGLDVSGLLVVENKRVRFKERGSVSVATTIGATICGRWPWWLPVGCLWLTQSRSNCNIINPRVWSLVAVLALCL
jgi:hypothetical protein